MLKWFKLAHWSENKRKQNKTNNFPLKDAIRKSVILFIPVVATCLWEMLKNVQKNILYSGVSSKCVYLGASPPTGAATLWGGNQGRLGIRFLHQGPREPWRHSQRCLQAVTGISTISICTLLHITVDQSSPFMKVLCCIYIRHYLNIVVGCSWIFISFFASFSPVWRTRWSVSKKRWNTFQLPPNRAHLTWGPPHSSVSVK